MGGDYQLANTVATDKEGMPKEPGGINGALYLRESSKECSSIVINVSSIDDYHKKIKAAGCKVVTPKTPVGNFGLYAEVTDTEGNVVGLWQDVR